MSDEPTASEAVRHLMENAGLPATTADVALLAMAYPSVRTAVARLHGVPCDDDVPVLGLGASGPPGR